MGLFLVILAHLYTSEGTGSDNTVRTFIYGFHMPFFFAVSGMLYKHRTEGLTLAIIKNIRSLLIPYIVFNLFFVLYNNIILDSSIYSEIKRFVRAMLFGKDAPCGASWFVLCLFVTKCIYDLIIYSDKRFLIFVVAFLTLLPFKFQFFYFSPALIGLVFFHLGHYSYKHLKELNLNKLYHLLLAICCFIVSWYLTKYNGKVSVLGSRMGNPVVFYVNAIIGSIGLVSLAMIIKDRSSSFIAKLSSASIGVVLMHMAMVYQVRLFRQDYILSPIELFLIYSAVSIVIYFICYLIFRVINKYLPWVFGRRTI